MVLLVFRKVVARFSSKNAKKSRISEDMGSFFAPWEILDLQMPSSEGPKRIGNKCHLEKSSDILDFLAFLLENRAKVFESR